jgi:hypothetical protein
VLPELLGLGSADAGCGCADAALEAWGGLVGSALALALGTAAVVASSPPQAVRSETRARMGSELRMLTPDGAHHAGVTDS